MLSTTSLVGTALKRCGSRVQAPVARTAGSKPAKLTKVARRSFKSSIAPAVDAHVHAFGRLIKAAVVDKDGKKKAGTKDNFKSSKEEINSAEVDSVIDEKKSDAERSIDSEREQVRTSVGSLQEGLFDANIARAKSIVDAAAAPAIDPMFSVRAQAKAYELHKVNSRTSLLCNFIFTLPLSNPLINLHRRSQNADVKFGTQNWRFWCQLNSSCPLHPLNRF